jgi:cytochrome c oxidase assembly factor CtaG
MTTCMILAIFGLLFGIYLILEGIFYFGLVKVVRPASTTEIRVSCFIIGLIFVVLAILIFAGVIPC